MPKALIMYFSLTGRTKYAAETLATELTNFSITIEPIVYIGKKFIRDQDRLMHGDDSMLQMNPTILDLSPYDLVCIGMPVHGGRPSFALDAYMKKIKGIEGKKVFIFATCRFLLFQTPTIMRTVIEQKGGSIVGEVWLKNFFSLKVTSIKNCATKLNTI